MRKIETVVASIITALSSSSGHSKAVLASLRSAPKLTDHKAQDILPLLMQYLDVDQLSRNGVPTRSETAVFTAIRLYALHQQGNDDPVYASVSHSLDATDQQQTGVTLFTALAQLRVNDTSRSNIDRRVQQALAMDRLDALTNALTHLVGSLHRSAVPVDYAKLGQNLYQFQVSYESANRVRLIWAQDYYYHVAQSSAAKGENKNDN